MLPEKTEQKKRKNLWRETSSSSRTKAFSGGGGKALGKKQAGVAEKRNEIMGKPRNLDDTVIADLSHRPLPHCKNLNKGKGEGRFGPTKLTSKNSRYEQHRDLKTSSPRRRETNPSTRRRHWKRRSPLLGKEGSQRNSGPTKGKPYQGKPK